MKGQQVGPEIGFCVPQTEFLSDIPAVHVNGLL
jgi:hypothetical protein